MGCLKKEKGGDRFLLKEKIMGLKVIVDSLDGLDEGVKNLYKPSGDKFVLDILNIDAHPQVSSLSKTMREERDARKVAERTLREKLALTDGLDLEKLKGIDPEKYAKALTDLEKFEEEEIKRNKKKLKDKEQWEKLEKQLQGENAKALESLQAEHDQQVNVYKDKLKEVGEAKDTEISAMRKALGKELKDKQIIAALAEAKGNIPILMPHISDHIKVLKNDSGEYEAKVVDSDGNARITDTGESMTISDFIDELREKPEFQGEGIFARKTKPGGSGADGNNGDNGSGEKNPFSKEHFNLTKQGNLLKTKPAEYERLKKLAGKG